MPPTPFDWNCYYVVFCISLVVFWRHMVLFFGCPGGAAEDTKGPLGVTRDARGYNLVFYRQLGDLG